MFYVEPKIGFCKITVNIVVNPCKIQLKISNKYRNDNSEYKIEFSLKMAQYAPKHVAR
jgi:hypothetical protein